MPRPARITAQIVTTLVETVIFTELFRIGGAWAEIRLAFEMKALQKLDPVQQMNALRQHTSLTRLPPLMLWHVKPTLDYVANGLVFAGALLVIILLFLAIRKRLHPWALLAVLAFALSFSYSLYAHSGFVPISTP